MLRRDKIQGIDKTCRLNAAESNFSSIIVRFSARSEIPARNDQFHPDVEHQSTATHMTACMVRRYHARLDQHHVKGLIGKNLTFVRLALIRVVERSAKASKRSLVREQGAGRRSNVRMAAWGARLIAKRFHGSNPLQPTWHGTSPDGDQKVSSGALAPSGNRLVERVRPGPCCRNATAI